jgi:hypothetical protein
MAEEGQEQGTFQDDGDLSRLDGTDAEQKPLVKQIVKRLVDNKEKVKLQSTAFFIVAPLYYAAKNIAIGLEDDPYASVMMEMEVRAPW